MNNALDKLPAVDGYKLWTVIHDNGELYMPAGMNALFFRHRKSAAIAANARPDLNLRPCGVAGVVLGTRMSDREYDQHIEAFKRRGTWEE